MTLGQLYIKYKFCLTFHYKLKFSGNNPSYVLKENHFKHQENESFMYQEALALSPNPKFQVPSPPRPNPNQMLTVSVLS